MPHPVGVKHALNGVRQQVSMHHALQSMHDETMYRITYISCMPVGVGAWWRRGTMGMYILYRINTNVHASAYISYHINANVYIIS